MEIKQNLVSSSKHNIKCPYAMNAEYITIHNTANSASAKNEINYMISNNNEVSFHVAVDDVEAIQGVPFNRNAWHCGDGGNGAGNRKSIGIEICYSLKNEDLEKFKKAEVNASKVVAKLLYERKWTTSKVKQHKYWSGKNCPHKTNELGWDRFIKMVQSELDALNKPTFKEFKVKIICDSLNVRKEANFDSKIVTTVKRNEVFTIVGEQNGLYKLKSGAGWISAHKNYVSKI